jgi:hypothetical protein
MERIPETETAEGMMIKTVVAYVVAFLILGAAWQGNIWLFHQSYPITQEYQTVNVTERMAFSGLGGGNGILITDTGEKIVIPLASNAGKRFWDTTPGHTYLIEYSFNVSPMGVYIQSYERIKTYPMVTNITRVN